jgi:hypothetical protein
MRRSGGPLAGVGSDLCFETMSRMAARGTQLDLVCRDESRGAAFFFNRRAAKTKPTESDERCTKRLWEESERLIGRASGAPKIRGNLSMPGERA